MRRFWIGMTFLLLFACSAPVTIAPRIPVTAPTPTLVSTISIPTVTPLPPTPTATSAQPGSCAYIWASRDLPDVSQQVKQAYRDVGLAQIDARAAAYGENCITDPNSPAGFSALQTDFYLTIPVENLTDTQMLGDWLVKALPVLDQFQLGHIPGPNLGYVAVRFLAGSSTAGTNEINLWFPRKTRQNLLQQGLKGSALYEALHSQ